MSDGRETRGKMKVDLMYSIRCIPHPWEKELRDKGHTAYCLCREVRLPVERGDARGTSIDFEPVALFNYDNEGMLFDNFCLASVPMDVIEPSQQLLEIKGVRLPRRP